MENIRYVLKKNNTCVIALIMLYDNKGIKPKKVYRVLSCVLYYLIDNYVCIDYLSCQSKTLTIISTTRIFKQTRFQYITWYWHSKTVTKPGILSWIHEETKFNCDIKLPISSGE